MNEKTSSETKFTKGAPRWLLRQEGLTQRQWKSLKRQHFKKIVDALNVFNIGCAYTPCSTSVGELQRLVAEISKSMRVKEWK